MSEKSASFRRSNTFDRFNRFYNDQSSCIFRNVRGSKCCRESTENDKFYCKIHKNKRKYMFEIMAKTLQDGIIECEEDIYKILEYIYDNDTYDLNGTDIKNDLEDKKELFVLIVDYLLDMKRLESILNQYNKMSKMKKREMIEDIHGIMYNTYTLGKNNKSILKIQRAVRKYLAKCIIEFNNEKSENMEDPFTFDSIDEIPANQKFSYKDSKGHIYIFNATEFEYFIRTNGNWNPYTKEALPDYVVNRLHILMKYNNLKKKYDDEFHWATSIQAFTDVSQLMEKKGFYNNVEWFNKLTFHICKKVIKVYRDLSEGTSESGVFFPRGFEISESNYVFEFCKEVIRLFKEGDDHYLLCCNFMKSLALYISEFYHNLPSWLLNIESPINFMNPNNGMFLVYVQSLIDSNIRDLANDILEDENVFDNNVEYFYSFTRPRMRYT